MNADCTKPSQQWVHTDAPQVRQPTPNPADAATMRQAAHLDDQASITANRPHARGGWLPASAAVIEDVASTGFR